MPSSQFHHVDSFVPIRSCQVLYVSSFISILSLQFTHGDSFVSIHSCQFLHCNSFTSMHSWQFIRFNSCVSIISCKVIHVTWFMSIHSCHHFILFQFTPFQLTMNFYKPCPFLETSAPARAGHYLVWLYIGWNSQFLQLLGRSPVCSWKASSSRWSHFSVTSPCTGANRGECSMHGPASKSYHIISNHIPINPAVLS